MAKETENAQSLVCPSCGGRMELSPDGKTAACPYCGHELILETEGAGQEEYARRMAKARAEEDIKDMRTRRQRLRRLKGWLIALCVIVGIFLVCALVPGNGMHETFFPRTVDPFEAVRVSYSGMSGTGKAEAVLPGGAGEYAEETELELLPRTGLSNGDTVTVKAKAPAGWRFVPAEKQFTVEGLSEWVLRTDQLSGDNLAAIHSNTERLIREDWEEILSSSLARELTYTPYRLYLFVTDEDSFYERNVLYDTYEVQVTREDGSVFTSYEACRYAELKIPADGVLTADYGSLQGFNLGYMHGFSYSHSFSGWTDAAEMEADLRHARDGYRLAD